ncbi:glutamate--tRNA ligase [Sphingobacterium alkalisoli]|uniref:Glutamate--tRNA ligase n=1 Tax=Sphingobacterium alkalisoli TaxID=1874115 RepID=A0A4U0H8P4_9SPHI|nr:glutamate--tRNA ligase [Sphingobacterium alkalisoli]TJY68243.1 glutamate--tRNA ligase [Sphingobacterium alkalisoli]GGH07950.1 glutamate--tRNA ligase [Sphingobacterium alkalisoli]
MNSQKKVRVRFAPSPTGGLHLGGVRTALFNYLFARHHEGEFILRIEDTDQTRFVPGAEEYITECLAWCGIEPDESPSKPGSFGPYRQSERKPSYRQYAEQLIKDGYAYYAFDTAEELEEQRRIYPNFRYGHENRANLRNSLSLSEEEVQKLLEDGVPYTVRIKMPEDEVLSFEDMIRGRVSFETKLVDDKVLLKADGMPTYHLAVVVDDKAMEISHIFRGEEWLPSAPVHVLLWEYLGWKEKMPYWAHLPLILKPDGNGKLSKRDGDRLGFPVYAMNWVDPKSGGLTKGFRELGFMPEAFLNILALLGWNDGTEQEIFTKEELVQKFTVERISKSGAKFDFEKAKWFNHEWIKQTDNIALIVQMRNILVEHGIEEVDPVFLDGVLSAVKERMTYISDFWTQTSFFFQRPISYDVEAIKPKWNAQKTSFFEELIIELIELPVWEASALESFFKEKVALSGMKVGELMMPFRIMLVGGKFGPDVFKIAELLEEKEVIGRIEAALPHFS